MTFKSKDIQYNHIGGNYVRYMWYKNSRPYRLKGPVYISPNGFRFWFEEGKLARVFKNEIQI